MKKYKFNARRWDSRNYEFIVTAESLTEAKHKVFEVAKEDLPDSGETEIIIELISVEIL